MNSSISFYQGSFSDSFDSMIGLNFDDIWGFPMDWIEPVNVRRGGWSGVTKHSFSLANESSVNVYLKRQENQIRRTAASCYIGRPTFWFESKVLHCLSDSDFLVPRMLCYGQRSFQGKQQAVLITEALEGYVDFEVIMSNEAYQNKCEEYLLNIGSALKKIHCKNFAHGALYAKHIFIQPQSGHCCFIDLERARLLYPFLRYKAKRDDIERLFRRTPQLTRQHRDVLMQGYFS